MPEKPDYDQMPATELPWELHIITRWPFNCHTHGLKGLVGYELSIDAGNSLFSLEAANILNSIGRAAAGGKAHLEPGKMTTYGPPNYRIPFEVVPGCTEHPDLPEYLTLKGMLCDCDACGAGVEVEDEKQFHRTVIVYEVLSEEPYEYRGLDELTYDVGQGDCSGMLLEEHHLEMGAEQMAALLIAQGSDPGFFRIGEDDD